MFCRNQSPTVIFMELFETLSFFFSLPSDTELGEKMPLKLTGDFINSFF